MELQDLEGRLRAIELKLEENNKILVRMRRVQRNAALVRAGYWVLIIALTFGSYYLIKPYISQLGAAYGFGADDTTQQSPKNSTSAENLLKQLEDFQKGQQ